MFAKIGVTQQNWLVVWNIWMTFPYVGNVITPTDELIFFRGVAQPPTSSTVRGIQIGYPVLRGLRHCAAPTEALVGGVSFVSWLVIEG